MYFGINEKVEAMTITPAMPYDGIYHFGKCSVVVFARKTLESSNEKEIFMWLSGATDGRNEKLTRVFRYNENGIVYVNDETKKFYVRHDAREGQRYIKALSKYFVSRGYVESK